MPIVINKDSKMVSFCYLDFLFSHDKPSRVYTIDADGVFTEASLADYWEDESESFDDEDNDWDDEGFDCEDDE